MIWILNCTEINLLARNHRVIDRYWLLCGNKSISVEIDEYFKSRSPCGPLMFEAFSGLGAGYFVNSVRVNNIELELKTTATFSSRL